MKCNIAQAKPRAPKEWERLPDRDKHIIIQYLKEKVMEDLEQTLIPDLVKINLDHEEAELQKTGSNSCVSPTTKNTATERCAPGAPSADGRACMPRSPALTATKNEPTGSTPNWPKHSEKTATPTSG